MKYPLINCLIQINKKNKGPNIEPCGSVGTPASTDAHVEDLPFNKTSWCLLCMKKA